MSRLITSHLVEGAGPQVVVKAVDDRSPIHGSNHVYVMSWGKESSYDPYAPSIYVNFQNGPVPVNGSNGTTIEALLAICKDRLEGFQQGKFPCDENAEALLHITEAITVLNQRTINRLARNVEGKLEA